MFAYCNNNPVNHSDPSGYLITPWKKDYGNGAVTYIDGVIGSNNTSTKEFDNNDIEDIDVIATGKVHVDISPWHYRINTPDVQDHTQQKHIHIFKNGDEYDQNIDGSPHNKHKSNKGDPPKWIRKKLKERGEWDWDGNKKKNNHKDTLNDTKVIIILPIPAAPSCNYSCSGAYGGYGCTNYGGTFGFGAIGIPGGGGGIWYKAPR